MTTMATFQFDITPQGFPVQLVRLFDQLNVEAIQLPVLSNDECLSLCEWNQMRHDSDCQLLEHLFGLVCDHEKSIEQMSIFQLKESYKQPQYIPELNLMFICSSKISINNFYVTGSVYLICINIQMNQKKKKQSTGSSKLKHVKSAQQLPIRSLMQQIGELKSELKQIKQAKRLSATRNRHEQSIIHNKQNNLTKNIIFEDVKGFMNKQFQLKTQIQVQKLMRQLRSKKVQFLIQPIIEILNIFKREIKSITEKKLNVEQQLYSLMKDRDFQKQEQQQKYRVISKNNKILQRQVEELKTNVSIMMNQKYVNHEQLLIENQKQIQIINELKKQVTDLTKTNLDLQSLVEEWELHSKNLQEKTNTLDRVMHSKNLEMNSLQQDVQYLRIQSEKFKNQKKQLEKLWEKSNLELKQVKKYYQEQMNKIQRDKARWMNQCQFRRHQSEQIQALQQQKELLFKEVQQMRNSYSLKCKQLVEKSTLLHQIQRKLISIQSQNFKLTNLADKYRRQAQYWQEQIVQLRKEVEQLSEGKSKIKNERAVDSTQKKIKEHKLKVLNDLHNMIKQQRECLGGEL